MSEIRIATVNDIADMLKLDLVCFKEDTMFSLSYYEKIVKQQNSFVCQFEDEVIGYILCKRNFQDAQMILCIKCGP